ncbi:hypothetical protein ATCC90586_010022 [Pythium insidiosum]|nr:hypothetical protein ATCC90586_010022 [Pythium insidiosum]
MAFHHAAYPMERHAGASPHYPHYNHYSHHHHHHQSDYAAFQEQSYVHPQEDATRQLPQTHALLTGALRRGKWTREEEEYAAATIQYFLAGVLPLSYGTTLRGYLAQQLHCDPMRVSKKLVPGTYFVGVRIDPKIGRRAYYPCASDTPNVDAEKQRAERHLRQLRGAFILSIEREELHERLARRQDGELTDSSSALSDLATFASQSPGLPHRQHHPTSPQYQQSYERPQLRTFSPPSSSYSLHHQRNASLPSLTDLLRQQTQSHAEASAPRSPVRPSTASPTLVADRASLPTQTHPLHGRRDALWPTQDAVLPPLRLPLPSRAATP